jgi:hypothetical protein
MVVFLQPENWAYPAFIPSVEIHGIYSSVVKIGGIIGPGEQF